LSQEGSESQLVILNEIYEQRKNQISNYFRKGRVEKTNWLDLFYTAIWTLFLDVAEETQIHYLLMDSVAAF
jgi:hypothetical protein